jgi:FkbM family methyltransferase
VEVIVPPAGNQVNPYPGRGCAEKRLVEFVPGTNVRYKCSRLSNNHSTFFDGILRRTASARGYALVREEEIDSRVTRAVEDAVGKDKRSSYYYGMRACVKRNPGIRTIIDIGASNGSWSRSCMEFYPHGNYLLVEAQQVHEPALREFCVTRSNCQFTLSAAGGHEGETFFQASDPFGGIASDVAFEVDNIRVPMITVDAELGRRKLDGPYLLKFDTHGFEVQILDGCEEMLKQTEVIIMECYNYKIADSCLLFFEMCEYLRGRGFRPVDMFDLMYRPFDDSLWQMEILFVREDNPVFAEVSYR